MDNNKQKAADLLQQQLKDMGNLKELNHRDSIFNRWREKGRQIFIYYFPEEKDWCYAFEESAFESNIIRDYEEAGTITPEDQRSYEERLNRAGIIIQAALDKLEIFGIKPRPISESPKGKGIVINVTNHMTNNQNVSVNVDLDQLISDIETSTEYSADQKSEMKDNVGELQEELKKENPSWEIIKKNLVWSLNFSKDLFIQIAGAVLAKQLGA